MFNIFRPRPRRPRNDVVPYPFGHFPRTNYVHQPSLSSAAVATNPHPRPNLQFAARIASTEWARIASTDSWDEVYEDLFQLACLDKFVEL